MSGVQQTGEIPPQLGKFRIDFIDPLFAVAIHIGFVEGLLKEPWAKNWQFPASSDLPNICMFGAGLLVIVASWVGYHLSVERRPLARNERFYIDIVLLILYFFVLLYFRAPARVCVCLLLIYIFYIVWDFYKTKEYPDDYYAPGAPPTCVGYLILCGKGWIRPGSVPRLTGEIVTFGWAVFFLALASLVSALQADTDWTKVCVGAAIIATNIAYRSDKLHQGRVICSIPFKSLLIVLFAVAALIYFDFARALAQSICLLFHAK